MSDKSLESKLEAADRYPGNAKVQLDLLSFLQEQGIRRPELELQYGYRLVTQLRGALHDDLWSWYEHVFYAALDMKDFKKATHCLQELQKKFPKSVKVSLMEGRYREAECKYPEAERIYKELKKDNPTSAEVLKAYICLEKARNNVARAIEELVAYVDIFSADEEAWRELAELYISIAEFEPAKFCYEELLLMSPEKWTYHVRYAELLFQLGGHEELEKAVDYFTQALELKPKGNLRALYGLGKALYVLQTVHNSNHDGTEAPVAIAQKLKELYAGGNADLAPIVAEAVQRGQ